MGRLGPVAAVLPERSSTRITLFCSFPPFSFVQACPVTDHSPISRMESGDSSEDFEKNEEPSVGCM